MEHPDLSRPLPVRDASPHTLHRLVERLRASSPAQYPSRLRELEDYLALMDDDFLLAYERGRGGQVKRLIERRRWLFAALDALAQGRKEEALKALERALRQAGGKTPSQKMPGPPEGSGAGRSR